MQAIIYAIILGIIEGITEFLPISSTGHLLIAQNWLPRQSDLFNTIIQIGAALALAVVFAKKIQQITWQSPIAEEHNYLLKLLLAFVITAIGGFILKFLEVKLPETLTPVAAALWVGGFLLIAAEWWLQDKTPQTDITWATAALVGIAQLLAAAFPGLSRSGSTIVTALLLGCSRMAATEFSFLLGLPTLLAAGALQLLHAFKDGSLQQEPLMPLMVSFLTSTLVSFFSVKWLLKYIQQHSFIGFGLYRIALGMILWKFCS